MKFTSAIIAVFAVFTLSSCARHAGGIGEARWESLEDARALLAATQGLGAQGLDPDQFDEQPLRLAMQRGDAAAIDAAAFTLFSDIAVAIDSGAVDSEARTNWRIPAHRAAPETIDAAARTAFQSRNFADAFTALAPKHDQYRLLQAALTRTSDPALRARIALNMDRWRWMPADLGDDYILVNAPAFELMLVRSGHLVDRRRVIIGTPSLQTPQIVAAATGIAFNPTWFVPKSIVAESVGALMKNNPERAAALGYYVGGDGGVRQKPGPANALGQMKILMPNPWSVFLHDTPGKDAFKKDIRALSHGCIRVDGAAGFAKILLGDAVSDDEIKTILVSRETKEVPFAKPLPVYIGYFTAFVGEDGAVATYPDIYGLDAPLLAQFGGGDATEDAIGSLIVESCPEIGEDGPKSVKEVEPR